MPTIALRFQRFMRELKRRRVFRVAVAYLAIAFVVLQVAEIMLPALGQDAALTVVVVLAILGFPVALVLAWAFDISDEGVVLTPSLDDEERARAPATPETTSAPVGPRTAIAVLPFKDLAADAERAWFADGIHEDILANLAQVPGLRVVSRTTVLRYANSDLSLRGIGAELGVGSVLEGSVRRAGERVRVVAQLIDVATDTHLWAATYDRSMEDIFEIQSDVARKIADALEAELSEGDVARITRAPTRDLEAYDLFLRARFLWNQRTERRFDEALALFREAAERDPGFAEAHAGLAAIYLTLGVYNVRSPAELMPLAERAVADALRAAPDHPEALAVRGSLRALYHWDWEAAEDDFLRAIDVDPTYATAPQWYALNLLAPRGRFDEAATHLEAAGQLDTESPAIRASRGLLLFLALRFDEARVTLERLLSDQPAFALGHFFLAQVMERLGRHDEALAALDRAGELRGVTPEVASARARVLAAAGREAEARAILERLRKDADRRYVSPTRLAQILQDLGDLDGAFRELDRALELRSPDLAWVDVHPWYQALRGDARYRAVAEALGFDA